MTASSKSATVGGLLALWTGLAAAVVVAVGGFDEPDLWRNGWTRLGTLAATAGALAIAFRTESSLLTRRLQAGVVGSLIAHTLLGVGLWRAEMNIVAEPLPREKSPAKVARPEPPKLPDFVLVSRSDAVRQPDFERPLETGSPQLKAPIDQPKPAAPKLAESILPPETPSDLLVEPLPPTLPARRPQAAAAPLAEDAGLLSRRVTPPAPTLDAVQPLEAVERRALSPPAPVLRAAAEAERTPAKRDMSAPSLVDLADATEDDALEDDAPLRVADLRRLAAPRATQPPLALPTRQPGRDIPTPVVSRALPLDSRRSPQPVASRQPRPAPSPAPMSSTQSSRPQTSADLPQTLAGALPEAENATDDVEAFDVPLRSDRTRASIGAPPSVVERADPGPGGLAMLDSAAVGLPLPSPAAMGSLQRAPGAAAEPRSSGSPTVRGEARQPAAAFTSRGERKDESLSGGEGRPSPKTEAAIERGLDFLAGLQLPDGRWSFANLGDAPLPDGEAPNIQADAAATGIALLAFLGAGYDHYGDKHQETVEQAIDYLVAVQKPNGELFPESRDDSDAAAPWQVVRYYSHGIATLALCEALGMTGDEELREPAQRAIIFLQRTQNDEQGGWRYTPGVNSDLSVTGWQLMALKSGELAGLSVDRQTYSGIRRFLASCREKSGDRGRYCYNPTAAASDPRTRHGRSPGTVMTSVGMLIDIYLDGKRETGRLAAGAQHLLDRLPTLGEGKIARTSTLGNPLRDTYYWYYATQVMYQLGGERWRIWNDALHPLLVESQQLDGPLAGSWDPRYPTPDKWATFGGRLYVTSMNLLSLEVHYRHLPIYETQ